MRRTVLVAAIAAALLATPVLPVSAVPAPQVPWSGWEPIGTPPGQPLVSSPAATSWGNGHLDVFARAHDGAVWHRWKFADTGWSEWHSLGGSFTLQPAVVSWGPGRIDVFIRGVDNALWHNWFDQNTWHTWEWLGGQLGSAPTVASPAPGRLEVFIRGTNGQVQQKSYDRDGPIGFKWSPGWVDRGAVIVGAPAAASPRPGDLAVVARGADGLMWERWRVGPVWQPWQAWPQTIFSGGGVPAVSSQGDLRLDTFVRGTDGHLLWRKLADSVSTADLGAMPFGPPYPLFWQLLSSTPASVSWGVGRIDLFVVGTDQRLYRRSTDSAG